MTKTEKTWQLHKPRGEWRLHGSGSFAEIREDGIAIAFPAFSGNEAESDNRLALMAAAPELLVALQRLLAVFKTCRVMACKEPMMATPLVTEIQTAGSAVVAAEDAIRKAAKGA